MPITVLSCGVDLHALPHIVAPHEHEADLVYASEKLLDAAGIPQEKRKTLTLHLTEQIDEMLKLSIQSDQTDHELHILILASGDALYHGIGGSIQRRNTHKQSIRFIPAPTAFQSLCHKIGLPWERATLFSAHAKKDLPLREILSHPMSIIYGGSPYTATDIAYQCCSFCPSVQDRRAIIATDLGTPSESIHQGTLHSLRNYPTSPTSILIILADEQTEPALPLTLGLDSSLYTKEASLITQEDVRALALAKLKLPAWGVLWDIGAGSGSVGLEAAGLRPQLQVYGLEQNEHRLTHILENKKILGVCNYELIHGQAPDHLSSLPDPDRVFIGGGGKKLPDILSSSFSRLRSGGLIVASAVTLESFVLLRDCHQNYRTQLLSLDIAHCVPIAGNYEHFHHKNRIYLFTFQKP